MSRRAAGVWIPLDQLLALPLPAEALATLWRESLRMLPPEASRERQALQQVLQDHDRRRVEALCEAGDIQAALSLLEGLAASLDPEALAALIGQLMPVLHRHLVERAGPDPAPELVADPQRADQLWMADRWMCRLEGLPHSDSDLRRLTAEHLCRYAAIAWMAQPGPPARWRAVTLLQRLLQLLPESREWALPAIRDRLLQGVQELERAEALADPQHLAHLLQACAAMEHDPQMSPQAREALQLAVFRGHAALEVWQNLQSISPPAP